MNTDTTFSTDNTFSCCLIIPVYNHEKHLFAFMNTVLKYHLPCILVDDGSNVACKQVLNKIQITYSTITLLTHAHNQGKGAAVMTAIRYAYTQGFTHAIQIDSDFQHNPEDIPLFLSYAQQFPLAVICGYPIYDKSAPRSRVIGHKITNFWVSINTLSCDIPDAMCGFRSYPLKATMALLERANICKRMTFDIDIIVKLYWENVPIIGLATKVIYPNDGTSHFRVLRDNIQIFWMHTCHFLGMLIRLPQLILRKIKTLP